MPSVEDQVRTFYDNVGWNKSNQKNEDTLFRAHSEEYIKYSEAVSVRTEALFDGIGGSLLIAGCGDLPDWHIRVANKFNHTTCIDISQAGLDLAKEKITPPCDLVLGSILGNPFEDNSFDAILCAHVIYHIDAEEQEKAVRELVRILKPGGKLVIIYVNHRNLPNYLLRAKRAYLRARRKPVPSDNSDELRLYFFAYPLSFWSRFKDIANTSLKAWCIVAIEQERELLGSEKFRRRAFQLAGVVERVAPWFAARTWRYVMPVMIKKEIRGTDRDE